MSGFEIVILLVALWLIFIVWILVRKLRATKIQLELRTENTHVHRAAKVEFFGPRLNVLCQCNHLLGTYMCIPVGPEGDVYGPETEKITSPHTSK